jgi:hypothetical protein
LYKINRMHALTQGKFTSSGPQKWMVDFFLYIFYRSYCSFFFNIVIDRKESVDFLLYCPILNIFLGFTGDFPKVNISFEINLQRNWFSFGI